MSEVKGFGRQKGHTELYRGANTLWISYPRSRSILPSLTAWLIRPSRPFLAAQTGKIGDGKIFVSSLEHVTRIRTGETGEEALKFEP